MKKASVLARVSTGSQHAFTLIELLVVVAIIVVLIAILLPSLGRAREQAKGVQCGAQLKQIGVGMYNYATENQGKLPPASLAPWGDPNTASRSFHASLWTSVGYSIESLAYPDMWVQNSLKRTNIFRCPVTNLLQRDTPTVVPNGWSASNWSYGVNTTPRGFNGSISLVDHVPATIVLVEYSSLSTQAYNWTAPVYDYNYGVLPHLGCTNVLFLDGHVELKKLKEISIYQNMPSILWQGS